MSPVFKSSHQQAPTTGWSLGDAQPKAGQQNHREDIYLFFCRSESWTLLLQDVILEIKSLERVYCSRTPLTTSRFFSLCPVIQDSKTKLLLGREQMLVMIQPVQVNVPGKTQNGPMINMTSVHPSDLCQTIKFDITMLCVLKPQEWLRFLSHK